ncbi:MAG: nodulation protein NfeD [Gammaproteobacteria bacterium]|nr:nodulation protein NfeD [Gammaproteobacteria bacterium]MDH5212960.1 nodulation protein NfeD [Gammaproteobacteria bacterium]
MNTYKHRILLALFLALATNASLAADLALRLEIDGAIGVATSEYIVGGLQQAEERGASLVIIHMDTPGGLVEPMRDIVQAILASPVPVVTYVSPGGARADSAGTYILLASHIAAMAPTTHLGAATPVALGGGDRPDPPTPLNRGKPAGEDSDDGDGSDKPAAPDTAMERKVLNDAVAYIRGLAEAHGRNADWAEDAVINAATLTAAAALEKNVIDLIADNESELLQAINGREVQVNHQPVALRTDDIDIESIEPGWRLKILSAIASPEIALLLMLVGIYGLVFEGWNPGAIVPGVVGVICLLLAAYALQVLPVNYAGLALILVGFALIIAESFVPSFGALGLGGIVAFIFGAIMMFDSGIPGFGISKMFVVVLALVFGLLLLWLVSYLLKLQRRGSVSGRDSIVGGVGTAIDSFVGQGTVWLEGEAWQAVSKVAVEKDQNVIVRDLDGLVLHVEPLTDSVSAELQTD